MVTQRPALVVIGPAGNGKSTLARALAEALGWRFIEGDDCHPPANVAKMARGEPLTDSDREPFLDNVGRQLAAAPGASVASCSALRRAYRERLRSHEPDLLFVWPHVPREELHRRLKSRRGHFMPPSLLDSQLELFEPPQADERFIELPGMMPVAEQVAAVVGRLGLSPPG